MGRLYPADSGHAQRQTPTRRRGHRLKRLGAADAEELACANAEARGVRLKPAYPMPPKRQRDG